ncbi:MAG: hypothetical protein KJN84_17120 [Bacteroidia bacterium]|nr:hypothetical protein [Bacteroidia bacterium]
MSSWSAIKEFGFKHIGLLSFLVFAIFASIYYQERTLFLDNPFQVFLMIVNGDIEMNADRWPAIVVRFLPFLLIKAGASLKAVLLSFSLSYVLFHFIVFCLLRYYLKDRKLAFLQLVICTVPLVHSFFWCNSELNLAMSLFVLLLGFYKKNSWFIVGVLSVVLLWLHPLIIFPVGFVFALEIVNTYVSKKEFKSIKTPLIFGCAFLVGYIIKTVFFRNWYDTMKSNQFEQNFDVYTFDGINVLKNFFVESYFLFPLLFIVTVLLLIKNRNVLKAVLLLLFTFIYLIILDIASFHESNVNAFYTEVNLLIVFFVCAYAIKNEVAKLKKQWKLVIFGFCVLLASYNWISTAGFYKELIEWIASMVKENDRQIIRYEKYYHEKVVFQWAMAYESLIISTLEGESKSFLFNSDGIKFEQTDLNGSLFIASFNKYTIEEVNNTYFDLEKSSYTTKYLD